MTNHVADICVGKMTEKEAIHEIELMEQMECACPDCERRRPALQMAIEALQFQQSVVRCGDCKYYICDNPYLPKDAHIMICDLCSVGRYRVLAESDGYCSDGERRDDADVL